MLSVESVQAYIAQLPESESFESLDADVQEKCVFEAMEALKGYFAPKVIPSLSARAVALQVLFKIDGDSEEFSKLRAQGVNSYSVKDVSVSFKDDADILLSGEAIELIERMNPSLRRRGRVGWMI